MLIFWNLPIHSDGCYLATSIGSREGSYSYLQSASTVIDHPGSHRAATEPDTGASFGQVERMGSRRGPAGSFDLEQKSGKSINSID